MFFNTQRLAASENVITIMVYYHMIELTIKFWEELFRRLGLWSQLGTELAGENFQHAVTENAITHQ